MVTVSHVVQKIINDRIFLQEGMNQGVISHTSLATKLKPEIEEELGKDVKHSAIVMALRRYEDKLITTVQEPVYSFFIEIFMKTNICYIVIAESPTLHPKLLTLYHTVEFKKGGILNIVQGSYQVGVVTNERYKEKLLDLLELENVVHVFEDLVSFSLRYRKDYSLVPGTAYNVLRFIAWENINIVSISNTPTELFLVIDKKDAIKSYKTLEKLLEKPKKAQIKE